LHRRKQKKKNQKKKTDDENEDNFDEDEDEDENDDEDEDAGNDSGEDENESDGEKQQKEEEVEEDLEEFLELESVRNLFKGIKFFLSREAPKDSLIFMIKCFGGEVGWEGIGSPFEHTEQTITHQVVDKDHQKHQYLSREYVQPQWIFDSINEKILLPISEYAPTTKCPPHLSPFVDDKQVGYVPLRREQIEKYKRIQSGQQVDSDDEKDAEKTRG